MKHKHLLLLSALVLLCQTTGATLIVAVLNGDRIYVAADSLMSTTSGSGESTQKVFRLTDSCLMGMSGLYGGRWKSDFTNLWYDVDFGGFARDIVPKVCLTNESLETNIVRVVSAFGNIHSNFVHLHKATTLTNRVDPRVGEAFQTALGFSGFDGDSNPVMRTYYFRGEAPPFRLDLPHQWKMYQIEGENRFPMALISAVGASELSFSTLTNLPPDARQGPTRLMEELSNLASDEFKSTAKRIRTGTAADEKDLVRFLLELFKLHKEHTARFHMDPGDIRPPYRIFRVTKGGIMQLN